MEEAKIPKEVVAERNPQGKMRAEENPRGNRLIQRKEGIKKCSI